MLYSKTDNVSRSCIHYPKTCRISPSRDWGYLLYSLLIQHVWYITHISHTKRNPGNCQIQPNKKTHHLGTCLFRTQSWILISNQKSQRINGEIPGALPKIAGECRSPRTFRRGWQGRPRTWWRLGVVMRESVKLPGWVQKPVSYK